MAKFIFLFTLLPSIVWASGVGGSAGGSGGRAMNFVDRNQLLHLDRFYNVQMSEIPVAGVNVRVSNLCIHGTTIQTIEPTKVETYALNQSGFRVNTQEQAKILATPLYQEVTACTQFKGKTCVTTSRQLEMIKTEFNMDVHSLPMGDNSFGRLMYNVDYQLPSCEDVRVIYENDFRNDPD